MSKVLTFSRTFPAYHPRKGEPTYFVEKILRSVYGEKPTVNYAEILIDCNGGQPKDFMDFSSDTPPLVKFFFGLNWNIEHKPKHHTIRAGNRWKVGDKFSPRVWSGKPYQSKQIIIAPDMEVKKVWSFDLMKVDRGNLLVLNGVEKPIDLLAEIAANDGLELADLLLWFKFPKEQVTNFQIICWSDSVNYGTPKTKCTAIDEDLGIIDELLNPQTQTK